MRFISYAQNFEDVLLWRALKHVVNGFYVDIGAHDPVIDSVSLAFYERGWRGTHIDAALACVERLRHARPDETVLHVALDEKPGVLDFFSFQENGRELGISCADPVIAERHRADGYMPSRYSVPAMTLDALLDATLATEIHWLKIDVEGLETRVLGGWNTSTRRPWILVIESTRPKSEERTYHEWESSVLAKGYRYVYYDGLNRYYIHDTHPELAPAFDHPPCVFDDFELHGGASHSFTQLLVRSNEAQRNATEAVRNDLSHLQSQHGRLCAEHEQLCSEHEKLCFDHAHLCTEHEQLCSEHEILCAEHEKLCSNHARLCTEHEQLNADLRQNHERLQEARHETTRLHAALEHSRSQNLSAEAEIQRLNRLLYGATAGQHLYRSIKVLIRDIHYIRYRDDLFPSKSYNPRVPWHTHVYRALKAPFVKRDRPWHTHLYRAIHCLRGAPHYSPQPISSQYHTLHFPGLELRFHDGSLQDQRGIGRVSREYLKELRILSLKKPSAFSRRRVVHFFASVHWCPDTLPPDSVVMIHDVIPLVFPEHFPHVIRDWTRRYPAIVRQAALVITISETSARDIHRHLGISLDRIRVVGNGVSPLPKPGICSLRLPDVPFLAYVGSYDHHKNLRIVLEALCHPSASHVHLVLIGKLEECSPEVKILGLNDRVHFLGRLDDENVAYAISQAKALVFPSLYEGFGLPPLEAALLGTPSICSDRPAMNEILRNAALFADPESPSAWASQIAHICAHPEARHQLAQKAAGTAKTLTWPKAAIGLLETFKSDPF